MYFAVLTIFPEMFAPFWGHGIVRRAIADGRIRAEAIDIRDHAEGRHRVTDDRPYGGGAGMVMKPEPLAGAIREVRKRCPGALRILLTPQGRTFDQPTAKALSREKGLVLVCGRYEGVDERVAEGEIDLELSTGDYVLTGGELAAMIVVDAVTRLVPGTLGGEGAAEHDTFSDGLLEHAHYTRPPRFEGEEVPGVLLTGNHAAIDRWRRETALVRTLLKRPDLLLGRRLPAQDVEVLKEWAETLDRILRAQDLPGARSLSGDRQER
jgi:tRNA (guanine37-N1)-methyltransferase